MLVVRAVRGSPPSIFELLLLVFKDLAIWGIWLLGALSRRVAWRGHTFLIGPGSRLTSLPSPKARPAGARAALRA
jgi:hypothetical protein